MYKTLGDYKWTDMYKLIPVVPNDECAIDVEQHVMQNILNNFNAEATDEVDESFINSAKMSLDRLKAVRRRRK